MKFLVSGVVSIVLFSQTAFGAPQAPTSIQRLVHQLDKSESLKKLRVQGGAVAIVHQNKVIYKKLFGFKKNKQGAVTEDTLFSLASVSKPISAALVGSLVQQKKLSFDEPIRKVMPWVDERILLKHLLSHSSGYTDLIGNKAIESGKSREELLLLFSAIKPDKVPGMNYSYSNVIFSFLEEVIRHNTQTSYTEHLKKFLSKIGVEGEQVCTVDRLDAVAYPHRKVGKRIASKPLPKFYAESTCSTGGLFLSLDQMSRFVSLMLGYFPDVLSKREIDVLFQPQVDVTDIFYKWNIKWPYPVQNLKSQYALGWRLLERKSDTKDGYQEKYKDRYVFHSGHLNGVSTLVGLIPEKDIGIVVLTNQDIVYAEPLGMDFWKLAIDNMS